MLSDLKTEVYPEDKIHVFPEPALGLGSKITIERATPVVVDDINTKTTYRTWKDNVKNFLEEKNIVLGADDRIQPNLEDKITRDLKITITRVNVTEITEREKISFKTISENDPSLEKGSTRIKQIGIEGAKEITYQVIRENAKEISRKLIKSKIVKSSQDKIVIKGTKTVIYGIGIATWYNLIGGTTAASNSLSRGTKVLVINLANNKSVEVTIADHGIQGGAIIDLSREAFAKIASLGEGKINVRLEKP